MEYLRWTWNLLQNYFLKHTCLHIMKHYPKITFNSSELILLNIRFLVFLLKKTSHHFHPNSAVNCQNNYVTNGKWSADLSNNKFATEEYFQKTFLCKWKVWKVNSRSINSNTRVTQGLIIKFLMKNLKNELIKRIHDLLLSRESISVLTWLHTCI